MDNKIGDWYWDNSTTSVQYLIANKDNTLPFLDIPMKFSAIKCRYLFIINIELTKRHKYSVTVKMSVHHEMSY